MPITLVRADAHTDKNLQSIKRIIQDLATENSLYSSVEQWHANPATFDLWFARFNDRNVGFALLKASEIKCFAVHGATRGRGIGRRILKLLADEYSRLSISSNTQHDLTRRLLDELKQ